MRNETVIISRFESGSQGLCRQVAEVKRTVHKMKTTVAHRDLCAAMPLERVDLHWIEYAGHRWPVRRCVTNVKVWELVLASNAPRGVEEK
jgi:hypothetical protein